MSGGRDAVTEIHGVSAPFSRFDKCFFVDVARHTLGVDNC